jgi:hypothetical protein
MLQKRLLKSVLSVAAIAGCFATGNTFARADGLPGITFRWNNREGFNELKHVIELSDSPNQWGRYRLMVGAEDMKLAASQFVINYPDYFDGKFNADEVEIRVCTKKGTFLRRAKCSAVAMDDVDIDTENRRIALYPLEPVPAGTNLELVLDDVKNPRSRGMYQFNVMIESPGDVPLLRTLGAAILEIN